MNPIYIVPIFVIIYYFSLGMFMYLDGNKFKISQAFVSFGLSGFGTAIIYLCSKL